MNKSLTQILNDARSFHRNDGSVLLYNGYKRKIDRAIAPEGQKKIACLELAHIMNVKPEAVGNPCCFTIRRPIKAKKAKVKK